MKSTPLLFACMASLALAGAIGERQNTPSTVQADSRDAQGVVSTNTNAAPTATSQPEKSDAERVKEHCGRFGKERGDRETCDYAAITCQGRVRRADEIDKFLQCMDAIQACSRVWFTRGKCWVNAMSCHKKQNLPLGDLDKLFECAKVGLTIS